ncbi:FG-GAP repeat domain-containing protein [Hymenobacter negativus]|uniref:VCBS repeat-containing protein n=1 Tax=Hymenobacter negativus TaxID=2795026 RepID=A0ABS3QNX6_9BACT|nr:VCBS repeat-containing protein [Hymenobacter negativus]MBO2012989.1 VCBS repeat-containing protein [Hymenobacter negativus]
MRPQFPAPLTVGFDQALTAGSTGALRVFSSERGGLRSCGASPALASGTTARFAPTPYPWMPGETVAYTVTTGAAGSGGNLAQGRVGQFTAAVAGTGTGQFTAEMTLNVKGRPSCVAAADVDGDLNLLTTGGAPEALPCS